MKKVVGKVTEEERNEIKSLFERKNGLVELAMVISPENQSMYEKLVMDLGETSVKFQKWWDDMFIKYQWEQSEEKKWEIDFSTCEIYLD